MSKADELIAGLVTDAQFDSDGSFSLDRDKAREKMRQFQLADPHRYVLLLVEAAVLRGATAIVFDIDADDMHVRFDAALSWEDLDELYGALFINRTTDEIRARRELALACNAVMALNPRWVRIESFTRSEDGALQGVRASLRSDRADEIEKTDKPTREFEDMPRTWTSIHVKERFRPGLMVRFLRDVGGSIPEEEQLRDRCRHASIPITLDRIRISRGLPSDLVGAATFELEHIRGVAGIDRLRRDSSGVVLLSNGVHINVHELGESIDGLWYWVDSSRFRKDVSQGDIVRSDPAYEAMLRALAVGRDGVLSNLAAGWHSGAFNDDSEPNVNEVFDLLRNCFVRWADPNWLRADAGPLGQIARLPLWRTVDRRWMSPIALAEQVDPVRGFMYTERDFEGVAPPDWGPVIHVLDGEAEIAAIRRVYPQAESVTSRLEREVPWELARRKWRARPHALELPQAALRHPLSFEQGEYRGRVALRPGQLSDVRIIVDGCLLTELELDLGGLGLSAVITGPLTPAADHLRPHADRNYATLLLLLLTQVPKLLELWAADQAFEDLVRRGLLAITAPDFAARWLFALGFTELGAKGMLERLGSPAVMPPLGLAPGQLPTAVAKVLTMATVDSRRVPLVTIDVERRERERERGKVLLVDRSAPTCTGTAELLLHVDADDRRLLALVFGADHLHDDTDSYVREIGRREFEAKPERHPTPPLTLWTAPVELERAGDRIRGHVGVNPPRVREWAPDGSRKASVELFTRGRFLCTLEEQSWLPGVEAELAWEGAPINADWNGIEGLRRPLREAIELGLIQILSDRAKAAGSVRPSDDERRLLWLAIVSPFVTSELFGAFRALRRHFADYSAAVQAYCEVMELFPGIPLADLREAIKLLLDDGKLPDRPAVLSLLDREIVPPGGGREFQRAVLGIFPLLESIRLVDSLAGPLSLAQVVNAFESGKEIAYVEDRTLTWDGATEPDARVIVRADEVDSVALIRLFGRETLSEVSTWIHERRNQQRFESRKPLEHIRLPDSLRLVGVEFERDGFCGELAIPDRSAAVGQREAGITKITFCHNRRVIEEIELHAALPVIGIVDDAHAELSPDYSKVNQTTARMAALRRLLDDILANSLLPRLAEEYEKLDDRRRAVASTWIAAHWRRSSMGAGEHPNRLTAAGKLFAQLKLFQDTDGTPRSLAELTEVFAAQRALWYVERHPGPTVTLPFPIVEARSEQLALLGDMFPKLEDFTDRWRARVGGERRKLGAKPLPPIEVPKDALVSATVHRNEMRGVLWLPARHPFAGAVTLGAEGKIVEVCDPVVRLPAIGIVGGELQADDGFETVPLTPVQRRYLESQVVFLYTSLLTIHERELARPDKVDFEDPEQAQRRSARLDILRSAVIELRRAELSSAGIDGFMSHLAKRLFKTPLLRLNTGRLISMDVAGQARPQEFAHLGIWSLDGPVLDAHARARLLLGEEAGAAEEVVAVVEPEPEPEPAPEPESKPEPPKLDLLAIRDEPPEPAPAPPEPPVDPVVVLLDRIRDELRLLRERHEVTLSEGMLDFIHAGPGDGKTLVCVDDCVTFDTMHPRFARALDDPDPIWVSFLASVAYTGLNHWLEEVSDDDELAFHGAHATLLLTALLG